MAAKKTTAKTAAQPSHEPPASIAEIFAVRAGEEDAATLNDRPAPRPTGAAVAAAPVRIEVAPTSADASLAKVVPLFQPTRSATKPPKGYREVEVIATRAGYYNEARIRPGKVFRIALASDGALPSWVTPAIKEDRDPEVARSRGVPVNSTGEEIRADVEEDAGTEQPLYLGGGGRQPDRMRS